MMVRDFQSVIGNECLVQMPEMLKAAGCTGRAARRGDCLRGRRLQRHGHLLPYIQHENTRLIGVEAAGEGMDSGKHSASIQRGSPGVLHGNRTYVLQDDNGQVTETHSISAGLDYPGVGPEHAFCPTLAAPSTWASPTRKRWRPSTTCAAPRASFPRWNPATPWPTP
jgi:tryptophan synthase beta chain